MGDGQPTLQMPSDDETRGDASVDPVVAEARRRWKAAYDWEANARNIYLQDLKFDAADADNGYQWPNAIRRNREGDDRPCLTINKTHQHNLQIINDAKQNKPEIRYRATGGGATKAAADVWQAIARDIEYKSNAPLAYSIATEFQVKGGIGYIRVNTRYVDDDSFDQEAYIMPVPDPLSVYLDHEIKMRDGSDAKWCVIYETHDRKEFIKKFPKWKDLANRRPLDNGDGWDTKDVIREAEYYRQVEKKDVLLSYLNEQGQRATVRKSQLPPEAWDKLEADPQSHTREVSKLSVEWYRIIGTEIVDRTTWPSKYIPVARVIGEESVIEGQLDRKGHTRQMKDPQRIYNYWSSSAVEHGALQSKSPWVASAKAIEGYQTYWDTANKMNYSVLPYNDWDDDGEREVKAPERPQPPMMADLYLKGMQVAQSELMMTSGQYQDTFGEKSNERSGKAIQERQRQGDNATYHFIDNLALAIRHVGVILLDLIPNIYDTERVKKLLAEDGQEFDLTIDPLAKKAYQEEVLSNNLGIKRVLNPKLGSYDVHADIGPAYSTKRQEAWNAYQLIMTQNPALAAVVGDLLFESADFPKAQVAADRLRRMVPPQALGTGPSMQEQQLAQQLQQTQAALVEALQHLGLEKAKLKGKDEMRDIDAYNAQTQRLGTFGKLVNERGQMVLDGNQLQAAMKELFQEMFETHIAPLVKANAGTVDASSSEGAS